MPNARVRKRALLVARLLCASAAMAVAADLADASELVYRPVSPGFGGPPLNGSWVLGVANANNRHEQKQRRSTLDDPAKRFQRTLESSLLGSVARQVSAAIFGDNASDEGRFVFGDTTVSFVRGVESIRIEILDAAAGSATEIVVPTLQVE